MPRKPSPTDIRPATDPAPPSPTARWLRLLWDYGPPLLVMALIYVGSQDVGSSAKSGRIIGWLLESLGLAGRLSAGQVEAIHYLVRKAGHVAEYSLLAVLVHRAVARGPGTRAAGERWTPRLVGLVLGIVSLYAASDELHQGFVASRTGSAADWVLDTGAAALALGVKWWCEDRWRRRSSA